MTIAAADSKELANYGITCGLANYAAAYATGLLLARRLLKDKKIDTVFKGVTKADGKLYNIENDKNERRPFKTYLDVGLVRTTTGNKVFGAMKGACDGGLNVPHNEKRFPGFRYEKIEVVAKGKKVANEEKEKPKANFNTNDHREHIFGVHVQKYYDLLKAENPARFKAQFSRWEKALGGKSIESLYTAAHEKIRSNPDRVKVVRKNAPVRKVIQAAPTLI